MKIYKETVFGIFLKFVKRFIFRLITGKTSILFLKGGDAISIDPQIFGVHEEPLSDLIKYYVRNHYDDFLIDIGSNIGLISCQNGPYFQQVHMFEPNPLCCNILEVNARLALDSKNYEIHRYGLGSIEKNCSLTVPKHNWGGAFIRDENNTYSDEILAFKDNYKSLDIKNYVELEVVIKESKIELQKIFSDLSSKDLTKGVIKIDVEGYEESVIMGIAKSIPKDIKVVILFESWNDRLDLAKLVNSFEGRCVAKKLKRHVPWKRESSKITKILWLLIHPIIEYSITESAEGDGIGDIILEIY